MGRVLRVVLMVLALTVGALVPAIAAPPDRVDVIVVLDEGRDARADAADMSRRYEADVEHLYEHVFAGFSASVPEGRLGALNRDPRVARVDENRPVHATAETAPSGVRRISAPAAHDALATGAGVAVGILDTGIRGHVDLAIDRDAGKDCVYGTASTDDVQGHGTHVAGTVAAADNTAGVIGVAPSARLLPIKVLGDNGSGTWATVACGLDHLVSLVDTTDQDTSNDVAVANLSLSGDVSSTDTVKPCGDTTGDTLYLAVCGAMEAGVTVVVAAGNDGRDASSKIPAAYPDVITVSALEDHDGLATTSPGCSGRGPWKTCEDVLASFSNHGSVVDVIAPGVAIESTTNNNGYGSKSGTSMAAPHVAGVAALILGTHGPLSPSVVRDHLLATGQCPDTTGAVGGACAGAWVGDPDGVAEPLVNAAAAITLAPVTDGGGGGELDNRPPTASFELPNCVAGTACAFTDTSTDPDGDVLAWSWSFGDGKTSTAQHPEHTYGAAGDYTVTLTVDDGELSDPTTAVLTVAPPPSTDGWGLDARGEKVKGEKIVNLSWNRAASTTAVDVWVDGATAAVGEPNDGSWSSGSLLGKGGGTHEFRVCGTGGTINCSGAITVTF